MSMGIDGISAMINQTGKSAADNRSSALQNKVSGDLSKSSDEELMEVCKDFEDASMSQLRYFYKEEMIQTFAGEICEKQNLGLAQQMYEQMKRNITM